MVVQAVVENALSHGVEPCLTPVKVSAYVMSGQPMVDVLDDGVVLGRDFLSGGRARFEQSSRAFEEPQRLQSPTQLG